MDCGEANIAAASAIAPLLFEMIEKSTDEWRVQVRQIQDRRGLTQSALCILQQQTESVAITCDGMAADLSLAHEAIDEVSIPARLGKYRWPSWRHPYISMIEPKHGLMQEFRRRGQIPIGIGDMHMAEIG